MPTKTELEAAENAWWKLREIWFGFPSHVRDLDKTVIKIGEELDTAARAINAGDMEAAHRAVERGEALGYKIIVPVTKLEKEAAATINAIPAPRVTSPTTMRAKLFDTPTGTRWTVTDPRTGKIVEGMSVTREIAMEDARAAGREMRAPRPTAPSSARTPTPRADIVFPSTPPPPGMQWREMAPHERLPENLEHLNLSVPDKGFVAEPIIVPVPTTTPPPPSVEVPAPTIAPEARETHRPAKAPSVAVPVVEEQAAMVQAIPGTGPVVFADSPVRITKGYEAKHSEELYVDWVTWRDRRFKLIYKLKYNPRMNRSVWVARLRWPQKGAEFTVVTERVGTAGVSETGDELYKYGETADDAVNELKSAILREDAAGRSPKLTRTIAEWHPAKIQDATLAWMTDIEDQIIVVWKDKHQSEYFYRVGVDGKLGRARYPGDAMRAAEVEALR